MLNVRAARVVQSCALICGNRKEVLRATPAFGYSCIIPSQLQEKPWAVTKKAPKQAQGLLIREQ